MKFLVSSINGYLSFFRLAASSVFPINPPALHNYFYSEPLSVRQPCAAVHHPAGLSALLSLYSCIYKASYL